MSDFNERVRAVLLPLWEDRGGYFHSMTAEQADAVRALLRPEPQDAPAGKSASVWVDDYMKNTGARMEDAEMALCAALTKGETVIGADLRLFQKQTPAPTCTAVGPMSACPNREPLLRTAADQERG